MWKWAIGRAGWRSSTASPATCCPPHRLSWALLSTPGPSGLSPSSNPITVLAWVLVLTRSGLGVSQSLQEEDFWLPHTHPIHFWWLSQATEPASTCFPCKSLVWAKAAGAGGWLPDPGAGVADSELFGVSARGPSMWHKPSAVERHGVWSCGGPGTISKAVGRLPRKQHVPSLKQLATRE